MSRILKECRASMSRLHRAGFVDNETMHEMAVLCDCYRIVVDNAVDGEHRYGWFATEAAAEDFAMLNRNRLGLDRCVSWHVEHVDA